MNIRSILVCVGVLAMSSAAATAEAQGDFRPQISDRQIQQVLTRLRTDADERLQTIDNSGPRGRAYGYRERQGGNDVAYLVDDLVQAADHLNDHVLRRQALRADVDDLLRRGALVDSALQRAAVQNTQLAWNRVRRDLDELATGYGMPSSWHNADYRPPPSPPCERPTGTYQWIRP